MPTDIEAGKEYTYRQMCEATGAEICSGKRRELQLKQWQTIYDIKKSGRGKYFISRIRSDEEVQYLDDLKNYSKYLANLLIDNLLKVKGPQVCYTYRELREMLGMVNGDYFPVKYHSKDIDIKIPSTDIVDVNASYYKNKWMGIADTMDEQTLNYILDKLSDENKGAIIKYRTTYKFYKYQTDEFGNLIFNPPHIATPREEAMMLEAQKDALNAAGLPDKQSLIYAKQEQRDIYYDIVNKFIRKLGYDKYGRAIMLTVINNLWKYAEVSKPQFNKLQVDRYLSTKRFKMIPPFINQQLVDGLIKIEEG